VQHRQSRVRQETQGQRVQHRRSRALPETGGPRDSLPQSQVLQGLRGQRAPNQQSLALQVKMGETVSMVSQGHKGRQVLRGIQARQECLVPPQTQGRQDHLEARENQATLVRRAPLPHSPDRLDNKAQRAFQEQMARTAASGGRVQLVHKALEALTEPTDQTDRWGCPASTERMGRTAKMVYKARPALRVQRAIKATKDLQELQERMASTDQRAHKGCKEIPVYLVSRGLWE